MNRRGHGEGSIYQRKDGLWVAVVDLGRSESGRRHRKWLYCKTRREASEKLKVALRAQQQGLPVAMERQTVGAYLEKWIAGAESSVRGSTFRRYSQLVRVHLIPQLGSVQLSKLAPADLSAAYAAMTASGLAPRTVGHAHRVLGRALRDAEIARMVERNAARLVRPPRVAQAEMHTLSAEQVQTLLHAAEGNRLAALYRVALASGARQGELLALRWSDVDWTRGAIRIQRTLLKTNAGIEFGQPKTSSSRRTITLGKAATEELRAHKARQNVERLAVGPAWEDGELIFTDPIGRPLDGTAVTRTSFYPLLKRAGLPRIRFHDLRHTAATLLLEAGTHPRVVADRLGHATPSLIMNVYGHVTERMQDQATAALDAIMHA